MSTENVNAQVQRFPKGHALYPDGRVIETKDGSTNEYTLEEWDALQQSQQS